MDPMGVQNTARATRTPRTRDRLHRHLWRNRAPGHELSEVRKRGRPKKAKESGSDADRLAAIAGAVCEALHGLPEALVEIVRESYLQGAEDITTTLGTLYERAMQEQ